MEGERFKTIFREGKEKKHLLDETLEKINFEESYLFDIWVLN